MRRGELWTARERGVLTSKPRPVLVVQNDIANRFHSTVTICLVTTTIDAARPYRVIVEADGVSGLQHDSEVQTDRLFSYQRDNLEQRIGVLNSAQLRAVDVALRRWLDL